MSFTKSVIESNLSASGAKISMMLYIGNEMIKKSVIESNLSASGAKIRVTLYIGNVSFTKSVIERHDKQFRQR
ncbi:MAG: hypothetical protein LBT24_01280 [Tannerella sp.]|nr:hypothetical protein [Tannerella sp.]